MAITINPTTSEADCFAFCGKNIIVNNNKTLPTFTQLSELSKQTTDNIFIEEKETRICALSIRNENELPANYEQILLRTFFYQNDENLISKTSRAKALTEWINNTRYCNICGHKLTPHLSLSALHCAHCQNIIFPRIEPCVIVVIKHNDKILLARHVQRNQNIYACIAGFMEAGETPEQAVRREVMEEIGLSIKNIKYFGSQSWPFPSQLMIGFTAEYDSGQIKLQPDEIAEAHWFSKTDNIPMPQAGSIAHQLICNALNI